MLLCNFIAAIFDRNLYMNEKNGCHVEPHDAFLNKGIHHKQVTTPAENTNTNVYSDLDEIPCAINEEPLATINHASSIHDSRMLFDVGPLVIEKIPDDIYEMPVVVHYVSSCIDDSSSPPVSDDSTDSDDDRLIIDEGPLVTDNDHRVIDESDFLIDEGRLIIDESAMSIDEGRLLIDEDTMFKLIKFDENGKLNKNS